MDLDLQPTFTDCLEWRDILGSEWMGENDEAATTSLDTNMRDEENVYFQNFSVDSPAGRMAVKTGSAPSDVDAAIDSLVPVDMRVTVEPARDTDKAKEQARKLSLWGAAMIKAWRKKRDVVRDIVCDQVIRRYGVGRVMYDSRLWPQADPSLTNDELLDWYAIHRRKTPIILERRNPRHTRWREYNGELLALVENYRTSVLEAWTTLAQYPTAKEILKGRRPNEQVTVSDVWIGKYRCMILEDQPVFPINMTGKKKEFAGVAPHGLPDIPYFFTPFRELPFDAPEHKFRGMLTNSSSLYKIESQVLTMQVWMLAWNAWRTWVGWTTDNRPIDIFPGQFISIDKRKDEYIEMLEGTAVPPEVADTVGLVDQYIQRNGVAQGPRSAEGTRSAQQLWAIQSARQLKLESPKSTLQLGLERALYLAASLLEYNVKEPITLPCGKDTRTGKDLGQITLSPQDINGYNDAFNVVFNRRLDPALLEQAKALMTFATNNWMPLEESWIMSGLTDDPQSWTDALLTQSTERLPFILELIGLERARSFYPPGDPKLQMLEQRVLAGQQGQGQPPQVGGPGQPAGGAIQPTNPNSGAGEGMGQQMGAGMTPRGGGGGGRRGGSSQRRQAPPSPGGGGPPMGM